MIQYSFPHADVEILGAIHIRSGERGVRPERLPAWTREQIPTEFMRLMVQTAAGVRLRFRTEAESLELDAFVYALDLVGVVSQSFPAAIDLLVDDQLVTTVPIKAGIASMQVSEDVLELRSTSMASSIRFPRLGKGPKEIELWLPHTAIIDLVEIRVSAPLHRAPKSDRLSWIHHGSSISHCLEAMHPTGTWPAVVARQLKFELSDLSFAGNALLDPFVARVIRDLPADLITLKLGINVVNANSMSARTFGPAVDGFLDTIRDGHKQTPIVVISPILCPAHENSVGPTAVDLTTRKMISKADHSPVREGDLTVRHIREILERIVSRRSHFDSNLCYLDGLQLLGGVEANYLEDGLHPNSVGHQIIGNRLVKYLRDNGLATRG